MSKTIAAFMHKLILAFMSKFVFVSCLCLTQGEALLRLLRVLNRGKVSKSWREPRKSLLC